jgi:hypothetical protein
LGYGIACVVVPFAGGKGPKMVPSPTQRELVPSEVRKIYDLGGRDKANKLLRFEPKHALTHGISPLAVDTASLVNSPAGPFKSVVWMDGARDSTAVEYAGQHRTAALELVLKATLEEYEKVCKRLVNEQHSQTLINKKEDLLAILREKGCWLVAYYNKGETLFSVLKLETDTTTTESLHQDKECSQAILLKLSTNNDHKAHPDTPQHHFKRVIKSLMNASDRKDYETTYQFACSLGANNQLDVKTLLLKYQDIIELFLCLYQYDIFTAAAFEPRQLLECKKVVYGVSLSCFSITGDINQIVFKILKPFLVGGYDQITYLSSALDLPLAPNEALNSINSDQMAARIHQQMEQAKADGTLNFSQRIATMLFIFANKNYRTHLAEVIHYFGQPSNLWNTHFEEYKKAMLRDIKAQIPIEKQQTDPKYSLQEIEILNHLPEKLHAILNHQVMTDALFVPNVEGMVPLLCPAYMQKLMSILLKMEKPISLVSVSDIV